MDFLKKNRRVVGQSLVEMLVAISVIVIALLGILVLVSRSLGINRVASEHYTAAYLAAEGIELVKNRFDRSFLQSSPGSRDFYGWSGLTCILPNATGNCVLPNGYGIYEIDYDDSELRAISGCAISGVPSESEVRKLFACSGLNHLNFDTGESLFSYNTGSNAAPSKFKRVIVIDRPQNVPKEQPLDYRVTSAVGWTSRGGDFVVQLEDHFLPWRLP